MLRRYDVLFIADEVICGFGRTGEMFGCDTFGIAPDIMTVAKALSAPYMPISRPSSAPRSSRRSGRAKHGKLGNFGHGFTYAGHPVAAAVALETLKIYQERDLVGRCGKVSPHFLAKLNAPGASIRWSARPAASA